MSAAKQLTVVEPPHSITAEQSLIGAAMLAEEAITELRRIGPEAFFRHDHKVIAKAILHTADAGEPVDLTTVNERLKTLGHNELAYLTDIIKNTPSAANAAAYANIIKANWHERRLKEDLLKAANGDLGALDRVQRGHHKATTRPAFQLMDCFSGYDAEFSYLVKGYLPANALGVIYGASGSFKSFHALCWAVHVALGRDWNGCRVAAAPVLYIAGEGGLGVPRRIKALANEYNGGKPIPNLYRLDYAVQLADVAQVNQLADTIRAKSSEVNQRFGLVVIDTLARCFGSGDENKTDDMGRFVAACDRIKAETGATVLVVHHSGAQDKERARGSTALRAACDFEYRIERVEADGPALVLISTKTKDSAEQPREMFTLSSRYLFTDSEGDEVVSLVCSDTGQEPPAQESPDTTGQPLSKNEQALWQAVRLRLASARDTHPTKSDVIGDLKAQGMNVSNFSRWLTGCIGKGVIADKGDHLVTVVVSDETRSSNDERVRSD